MVITSRPRSIPDEDSIVYNNTIFNDDVHDNEQEDLQHVVNCLLEIDEEEQTKKAALFILHLKESRNLSQVAVDDVIKEVNGLFSHVLGRIKAGVFECLAKPNTEQAIQELFTSATSPFEPLHSTFLQENYYRSNLGCMVCLIIISSCYNTVTAPFPNSGLSIV